MARSAPARSQLARGDELRPMIEEPLSSALPHHVLVVEDDVDIRDVMVEVLHERGYRVGVATNGREAIEYLASGELPDLILLDLMMPVADGLQFREWQLADPAWAKIPVAVLSADRSPVSRADALPGVERLYKPITVDDLIATVERILG